MDKIRQAIIYRNWTTKRIEIHDVSSITTMGSVHLKAFSKLCHREELVKQRVKISLGRRNRNQNLGLLNKQICVGQRKNHR